MTTSALRTVPFIIGMFGAILSGCFALHGSVSTISYSEPPQPRLFYVSPNSLSVTDQNIKALIEAKLIEKGYQKAASPETANIGVVYKYSIDQNGSTYSEPDYALGGYATHTIYPRHFQIAIVDLMKRKPDQVEFFWQGEVYSAGSSRNIALVAPYFIDALFENYGKTVSNVGFSRMLEP
jgi:hypothetical protein